MQALGPQVFGFALVGLLMRSLFRRKNKALELPKASTLAERGTQLTLLIGADEVAPLFAEEGRRYVVMENNSKAGGKGIGAGGAGLSNEVYFADGMHMLAVGPGRRLKSIKKNGELLWPKPNEYTTGISITSAPSGTRFSTIDGPDNKDQGDFSIFWGEKDQPFCDEMIARTGVRTRWPYVMYVYWHDNRLGGPGTWGSYTYDIEVPPFNEDNLFGTDYDTLTHPLSGSDPWLTNGTALSIDPADTKLVLNYVDISLPTENRSQIWVEGDQTTKFTAPRPFELRDTLAGLDGQYRVVASVYEPGLTINLPNSGWTILQVDYHILNDWNKTTASVFRFTNNLPPGLLTTGNAARWQVGPSSGSTFEVWWSPEDDPLNGQPTNGDTGDFNDFGSDYHTLTVYVNSSALNAPVASNAFYTVGFRNASGTVKQLVYLRRGVGSNTLAWSITVGDGVQVSEFERIGTTPWFKVQVMFHIPPGGAYGLLPTDQLYWTIGGDRGSTLTSFFMNFALSDPAGNLIPFCRRAPALSVTGITRVYVAESMAGGIPFKGTATPYISSPDGTTGANGAHIIRQLLFESDPHGLGLEQADFDLTSLEALGVLLDAGEEGIRSHVVVNQRTTVKQVLADLMADLGVEIVWDVTIGKYIFLARRAQTAFAKVPREMLVEHLPTRLRRLDSDPARSVAFQYTRAQANYSNDTIEVDDLGSASFGSGRVGAETSNLNTVRDRETAVRLAAARAKYEVSRVGVIELELKNDASTIRSGDVLDISLITGVDLPFRVFSVEFQPRSPSTTIRGYYDVMNTADTQQLRMLGPGLSPPPYPDAPEADFATAVFEETSGNYLFLRIPSSADALGAALQVSDDGTSFWTLGVVPAAAGGYLIEDFGITGAIEDGFVFRCPAGRFAENLPQLPAGSVVDGVLRCITEAREIVFLRELESIGDNTWRAKGLLRAQSGTTEMALTAGDKVWIWVNGSIPTFAKNLPSGATPEYKLVPMTTRRVANPALVSSQPITP